ncbi:hypothetical protein DM02DRAFT_649998 [Periconia macrospinosa]|uniref:Uncharacterized protein n=1 Tax=Periconia macrospinosa TaxID=97972 RepID=A0A2V1E7N8_9PLEO|nr:hypothetical protein DM02DRAFT_649998 [Periconia macrospinosa]
MVGISKTPEVLTKTSGLEERMTELEAILKNVDESIKIRNLLVDLAQKDMEQYHWYYYETQRWVKWIAREKRTYTDLKVQVDTGQFSQAIQVRKIDEWMEKAKALQRNAMNQSELVAENEWDEHTEIVPGIFKEGWSWAQEEGSGPGLTDLVDPKDASNKNPEKTEEGAD